MIQYRASAFRYCGMGNPVKHSRVMLRQMKARVIENTFNDIEPIRLLDTSAERDDTVHINDAHNAKISPNIIISKNLQREYS